MSVTSDDSAVTSLPSANHVVSEFHSHFVQAITDFSDDVTSSDLRVDHVLSRFCQNSNRSNNYLWSQLAPHTLLPPGAAFMSELL